MGTVEAQRTRSEHDEPVVAGPGHGGALRVAVVAALLAVPALVGGGPRAESVAALPVVRRLAAARPEPESVAARAAGFAASLQPAWWLLRALVAAMLVGLFLGRGGSFEWTVVALTLVFGAISVWLGFRSRVDRRWLWLVVPLNAFAAALVLTGWPGWASTAGYVSYGDSASYLVRAEDYPGLWQDEERQVEDIRPVDANGVPLSGVYLFDQDGRPIDAVPSCTDGDPTSRERAARTPAAPPSTTTAPAGACGCPRGRWSWRCRRRRHPLRVPTEAPPAVEGPAPAPFPGLGRRSRALHGPGAAHRVTPCERVAGGAGAPPATRPIVDDRGGMHAAAPATATVCIRRRSADAGCTPLRS